MKTCKTGPAGIDSQESWMAGLFYGRFIGILAVKSQHETLKLYIKEKLL